MGAGFPRVQARISKGPTGSSSGWPFNGPTGQPVEIKTSSSRTRGRDRGDRDGRLGATGALMGTLRSVARGQPEVTRAGRDYWAVCPSRRNRRRPATALSDVQSTGSMTGARGLNNRRRSRWPSGSQRTNRRRRDPRHRSTSKRSLRRAAGQAKDRVICGGTNSDRHVRPRRDAFTSSGAI